MIFRLVVFAFSFCTAQNITTEDDSLRFENGDSRIIQLKSDWNVFSYVYTEHQDDVININCTSGSLSTYNCSLEFDKIQYLNITSKSIGVDFLKMNDTNSTIFRAQIIKSDRDPQTSRTGRVRYQIGQSDSDQLDRLRERNSPWIPEIRRTLYF